MGEAEGEGDGDGELAGAGEGEGDAAGPAVLGGEEHAMSASKARIAAPELRLMAELATGSTIAPSPRSGRAC